MGISYYNAAFGLGSNLGGRLQNLRAAVEMLSRHGFIIDRKSNVFETEPWGVTDQPSFLNACVGARIKASLSPSLVLKMIKITESDMGRVKGLRWGPRIIDIDLLLMDSVVFESKFLTVPHIEIFNRAFVLYPLAEIFPRWTHPVTGENVSAAAMKYPSPVRIVKL